MTTTATTAAPLMIRGLHKSFAGLPALQGIDLQLKPGEILALLGASGCGKTTLLRCIAGLLRPDQGEIDIGGQAVSRSGLFVSSEARHLGMVFQDYALWPHMTVAQNVEFPLTMRRMAKPERHKQVDWALQLVGLSELAQRAPETLSGGQQQRVALARAIVSKPKLLLMDEPLSNLDKSLRESLAMDIRQLVNELGLAAVFVTHDQHEAFALADQVAVLQQGEITQLAAPSELYQRPANPDIARFLDAGSLVRGRFSAQGLHLDDNHSPLPLLVPDYQGNGLVMVPRQALQVGKGPAAFNAMVKACLFQAEHYSLVLELAGGERLKLYSPIAYPLGQWLPVRVRAEHCLAWDAQGQALSGVRHASVLPTPTSTKEYV